MAEIDKVAVSTSASLLDALPPVNPLCRNLGCKSVKVNDFQNNIKIVAIHDLMLETNTDLTSLTKERNARRVTRVFDDNHIRDSPGLVESLLNVKCKESVQ